MVKKGRQYGCPRKEKGKVVERKTLSNRNRGKKLVDMEKVYRQLDNGRSVADVAAEWGVSTSTLYRRHREYQAEARAMREREPFPPEGLEGFADLEDLDVQG